MIKSYSNESVDVKQDSTIIASDKKTTIDIREDIKVNAHPRDYKIVGSDVYLIRRNSDPDQWFRDMLDAQVSETTLASNVDDINNRFTNFEEGITLEVGEIKSSTSELSYNLNVLSNKLDLNSAGIFNLTQTRVTQTEAAAISESTIAAWSNSTGSAWFDSKISTVSNLAKSAVKNASTLTAAIDSQQEQIQKAFADISILEKQVDGKVETWFGTVSPVDANGDIVATVEPYASWLIPDERVIHTGDTYVHYELDASNKKRLLATYRFMKDAITDEFSWDVFTDDLASSAYQRALIANDVADSKIVTWYQTYPPAFTTQVEKDNATGDIWLDSDDNNRMYRWNGSEWTLVEDSRIQASVDRLDEATVDVNGIATAKSTLKVNADGNITGFVASATNDPNYEGTEFKIFADKFSLVNSENNSYAGAPFFVDTTTNQIRFKGNVSFIGTPVDTALQPGEAASDINAGITTINGDKITTGSINANRITANTTLSSPVINSGTINSTTINSGTINGTTLNSVTINTGTLNANLINSGSMTNAIPNYINRVTKLVVQRTTVELLTYYIGNSSGTGTLISAYCSPAGSGYILKLYRGSTLIMSASESTTISFIDAPYDSVYKLVLEVGYIPVTGYGTIEANIGFIKFKK